MPFEAIRVVCGLALSGALENGHEDRRLGCAILENLSAGDSEQAVQEVIESGVPGWLMDTAERRTGSNVLGRRSALRALSNLLAGTDDQATLLLQQYPRIPSFLRGLLEDKQLKRDALFAASNLSVGTRLHVRALRRQKLWPKVCVALSAESEPMEVRREALVVVANVVCRQDAEGEDQLVDESMYVCFRKRMCVRCHASAADGRHLLEAGAWVGVCALLQAKESAVLLRAMAALHGLLRMARLRKRDADLRLKIEQCGGLSWLEFAQRHASQAVYARAHALLCDFFEIEASAAHTAPFIDWFPAPPPKVLTDKFI